MEGKRSILRILMVEIAMMSLISGGIGMALEKNTKGLEQITFGSGQIHNPNVVSYELGIKQGIYRKEGIDMEFLLMKGFAGMASLVSGHLDYAAYGGTDVRSAAAGMPLKVVMVTRSRAGMVFVVKPGIKSAKELKGKIIGVGVIGDTMDYSARAVLAYQGLDPEKDVTIRPVGVGMLTYMAIRSGMIDGAVMNIIRAIQLTQEGKGKILMSVDEAMKGVSNTISVSVKKIKENPNQIKKVIRGTFRSIAFVMENRKEVIDFMIKDWGIGRELASAVYEREKDGYNLNGKAPDENFQTVIKDAQDRSLLPSSLKVPISQLRDFTLLEEVLKEIGIR